MVPFLFPVVLLFIASISFIITFVGKIRVALRWFWQVLFCALPMFFPFIASFDFWFTIFSVIGKISYLLDDESDQLGSDYGSSGMYSFHTFHLRIEKSVVSVSVLGSDAFAPTGVDFQRWLTPCIILALNFLIFPPNVTICFIFIVQLCTHIVSNRFSFSKI